MSMCGSRAWAGASDQMRSRREREAEAQTVVGTTKLTADLDTIVESVGEENAGWHTALATKIAGITEKPGVYLFTLPADDRYAQGRLMLHGRTFGPEGQKRQIQFQFTYAARKLEGTSLVILYVGKAANLRDRLKNHLNLRNDSTTSQMLKGLASQAVHHGEERNVQTALTHLRERAQIIYYELGHEDEAESDSRENDDVGESFTSDRDLLEIKLIAKYAPPFNIKAER